MRVRSPHSRWLRAVVASLVLSGPAVGQEEVPFITTPDQVTLTMLQLAEVTSADRIVDLGSGDGRIVITAARRFGARGRGIEIVPDLVQRSRDAAVKAGVAGRVEFLEQDLFKTDLSDASVVTLYLLPEVNLQLRPTLLGLRPGTRIVSHDWDMGDWAPDRTLVVDVPDKAIGREKFSRVHLWWVPAKVEGIWCGPRGQQMVLKQQFQTVQGALSLYNNGTHGVSGRMRGADLSLQGLLVRLEVQWQPDGTLRVAQAEGNGTGRAWRGQRWWPLPPGNYCPGWAPPKSK